MAKSCIRPALLRPVSVGSFFPVILCLLGGLPALAGERQQVETTIALVTHGNPLITQGSGEIRRGAQALRGAIQATRTAIGASSVPQATRTRLLRLVSDAERRLRQADMQLALIDFSLGWSDRFRVWAEAALGAGNLQRAGVLAVTAFNATTDALNQSLEAALLLLNGQESLREVARELRPQQECEAPAGAGEVCALLDESDRLLDEVAAADEKAMPLFEAFSSLDGVDSDTR